MPQLTEKVILITGGTTGIGLATAHLLADEGATVIITGKNPETLDAARAELGAKAEVMSTDTADLAAVTALFQQIKARHGALHGLFANAGVAQFAPLEHTSPEFFDNQFSINVRGLFFTVQGAAALMSEGASIVLNASVAASRGFAMSSVYSATKAAVRSFSRTLAAELAPRGIRINTISPGPIDTPIMGKMELPKEAIDQFARTTVETNPMKRVGTAHEVAQAALFLLSSASSYTTGSELFVDGGVAQV